MITNRPKELTWQHKIIKSVRQQGGYGKKWSSTYAVGVPDLILSLPDIGAFLMEVKLEHSLKPGFDRQIKATPKQRHELASLVASGARALLGVVLYRGVRDVQLVALPSWALRVWDGMGGPSVPWRGGQGFDVEELMGQFMYEEFKNG